MEATTNGVASRTGSSSDELTEAVQRESDLRSWAPTAPPLERLPPSQAETYLPPSSGPSTASSGKSSYQPTSKPFNLPLTPNQESMNYSLARLLSRPRFAAFLSTPLGFSQFKAYLSQNGSRELVAQLDLWRDLSILDQLKLQTGFVAKGFAQVYADDRDKLPRSTSKGIDLALRATAAEATSGSLLGPAQHLLDSLYASQFEGFMRSRLVKATQEQLKKYHLHINGARSGIGEAYVLVNPRLTDRPIVLVSQGFEKLTGYHSSQIIGRNCRFLQGKSTSPTAVKAIKDAVDSGSDATVLILNYTSEARPFMNLLTLIALHDVKGSLTYFIGGQSDLTEALTSSSENATSLVQPEGDAFAVDVNSLSEPVLAEARNAAASHEPSQPLALAIPPSSSGSVENGEGLSRAQKLKRLCYKLVGKATSSNGPVVEEPQGPLVPSPSDVKRHRDIDSIASEYSSTYDKLLVVTPSGEIVFATAGFLRCISLPCTTKQEIQTSPLVHLRLLKLLVAPTTSTKAKNENATKELRDKVKVALKEGQQTSFSCGIRYTSKNPEIGSTPLVFGRLYISPLKDRFEEVAASTVVFA